MEHRRGEGGREEEREETEREGEGGERGGETEGAFSAAKCYLKLCPSKTSSKCVYVVLSTRVRL